MAHPGLTLTGMYKVLETLRAGRELTAKEKSIHTNGLLAVLASLDAQLDAAVVSAYGWDELAPSAAQSPALASGAALLDALLTRFVQLNAQRAAEEVAGHIRWLRTAFQDPSVRAAQGNVLSNQELLVLYSIGLQADLALETVSSQPTSCAQATTATAQTAQATPAPQAWPADLPGQVRAVAQVLERAPALPQLEAHFKGRGVWKNRLPRIFANPGGAGQSAE